MIPPFIRLLFQWALYYPCIVFPPLTEPDLHRIASPVISTNQPISNQETSVALACSAPSRNYSATKISNKQKLASDHFHTKITQNIPMKQRSVDIFSIGMFLKNFVIVKNHN